MNAMPRGAVAPDYRLVDISPARQLVVTFLDLSSWGHTIFGLVEVDVTAARARLAEHEAHTGERLSFSGYLVYCLARAVDADKRVQAYRKGWKQLAMFDDVDVGIMVEHEFGGKAAGASEPAGETRAPIGHVIRRANRKTYMEIHREIRALQARPPARKEMPGWMRLTLGLPGPVRKLIVRVVGATLDRDPAGRVAMIGTVGLTSVGMFGKGPGWGLGAPNGHSLSLLVGGIARKPVVVADRIEPREMLSLTLAFDHDVVDGAPAARFTRMLTELMESGCGLDLAADAPPLEQIHA